MASHGHFRPSKAYGDARIENDRVVRLSFPTRRHVYSQRKRKILVTGRERYGNG